MYDVTNPQASWSARVIVDSYNVGELIAQRVAEEVEGPYPKLIRFSGVLEPLEEDEHFSTPVQTVLLSMGMEG